jgi:RNA polymerase sigma factor (sigma-70 family)
VQSTLREVMHDQDVLAFRDSAALQAHVYQVAARKLLSKGRFHSAAKREFGREERMESFDQDEPALLNSRSSPSGVAIRHEELDRLRAAIDALEPRDRQILVLRKLLGVSTNEIADELGIAESTVRWRLGVALTTLAVRLGAGGTSAT